MSEEIIDYPVPLPIQSNEEGGEPKPPEIFVGIGMVGVDENGIIITTRFGTSGITTIDESFQYIFPNITNVDIMKARGGTVEIINHKPTIKFSDGSVPVPPPEPVQPPTTEDRLKMVEGVVMDLMMKEMMMNG